MRSQTLKETLIALVKLRRTTCIESSPGTGKTSIVHQVGKELGIPVIEKCVPNQLVEDFGVQFPTGDDTDVMHYRLPDWFPVKGKAPEEGILLFDDRNQATVDIQKVLANICQARNLHGVPMPDGWTVISTGNRQSDRAGANRVLTHLRNRETVLEMETHLDDWTGWALKNEVHPLVIAFIRFRPELLDKFDPQQQVNPTPRSWVEGVSAILGKVPEVAEYECIKGAVGEGAAAEFMGFAKVYRDLPDLDGLIKNPTKAKVPSDPATLYALASGLAHKATKDNLANIVTYLARLPAEFSVLCISLAVKRDGKICDAEAFMQWATKNNDVLF